MTQTNTHKRAGGMGSATGFIMAMIVLAVTAFVFVKGQPSSGSLVWADVPAEETVVASATD